MPRSADVLIHEMLRTWLTGSRHDHVIAEWTFSSRGEIDTWSLSICRLQQMMDNPQEERALRFFQRHLGGQGTYVKTDHGSSRESSGSCIHPPMNRWMRIRIMLLDGAKCPDLFTKDVMPLVHPLRTLEGCVFAYPFRHGIVLKSNHVIKLVDIYYWRSRCRLEAQLLWMMMMMMMMMERILRAQITSVR
jgi:hypothetical protein